MIPFALARSWHLWSQAWTDRSRPPLGWLRGLERPETFLWAMLPHAARSFAAAILLLPERMARPLAVAYLQCRALDTIEDHAADLEQRERYFDWLLTALDRPIEGVALRELRAEASDIVDSLRAPRDDRERAHRILLERVDLLAQLAQNLPPLDRAALTRTRIEMAHGMRRAAVLRAAHGKVLPGWPELEDYADAVIGAPFRLCAELQARAIGVPLAEAVPRTSRRAAFFVQMANALRDLDADVAEGHGWVADLAPVLGQPGPACEAVKAEVRRALCTRALATAGEFAEFLVQARVYASWRPRAAGALFLRFTAAFYTRLAVRHFGFPARRAERAWPSLPLALWSAALPGAAEGRVAREIELLARVERWVGATKSKA